ncbi:MAG: Holliday junction DNA helicase RuvA [Candidatus Aminicenantes bacterium RBG_13_59_9]|nr:MAG: Holliday junction DNA helicase RuvA [Candidatus Aminicenantes bacterium RBG_13_59_9]
MIAHLKGQILHKTPGQVVVDIGGVGYCAYIPLSTYVRLGDAGSSCELHIYTHLTDSALALYGFTTGEERELFLKLIAVSGIGPKLALNVLSGIGPAELEEAVLESDVARITLIPGIGKKLAIRIALELQEKIEKKEKVLGGRGSKEREDLISTLMNLGFRRKEVEGVVDQAIRTLKPQAGIENLLRECLRKLARV